MSARTKESFFNSLLDAQDPGVACQVGSIRAWDILQSAIREKGSGPNKASSKIWGMEELVAEIPPNARRWNPTQTADAGKSGRGVGFLHQSAAANAELYYIWIC
jgi:hypothetical protein